MIKSHVFCHKVEDYLHEAKEIEEHTAFGGRTDVQKAMQYEDRLELDDEERTTILQSAA